MLALSPTISNFGWCWEDPNTFENQENPCIQRTDQISNSVNADRPHSPFSNNAHPENDDFSSFHDGFIEKGDTENAAKKLNHNACERDRRKKINTMYSTLRSLLPDEDQTKKLSIPATVSRVLKYIPELQKQVQRLGEKKEQLLSKISRQQVDSFIDSSTSERRKAVDTRSSLSAVSATRLDNGEMLCQFATPKGEKGSFSTALLKLEEEAFLVLNVSCFESSDGRIFNNLHLEGRGSLGTVGDEQYLIEKLLSFNEKMGEAEKRLVSIPNVNYVPINNELTNINIGEI